MKAYVRVSSLDFLHPNIQNLAHDGAMRAFLYWFHRVLLMIIVLSTTLARSCTAWTAKRHVTTMSLVIPRAAVSVVALAKPTVDKHDEPRYVLVKRGKEPNKGKWSLPGGKIEAGETTLAAAMRELREETQLLPTKWHEVPFCSTDSIHWNEEGEVQYHYVISQCFCILSADELGSLQASDDAAEAECFSLKEMKRAHEDAKHVMPAVIEVVERTEKMYQAGILTVQTITAHSDK